MESSLVFYSGVIGHRGACAYAPENTMASFVKATQLGVKWVEFDVRQALTGEVIIFHDDYLDRTTEGKGIVSQFPLTWLSSLDAGSWFDPLFAGERIPTLMPVLDFLQEAQVSANVELKAPRGEEEKLVKRVLMEMSSLLAGKNHQFIFSSFSFETLQYLRYYSANCQIGLLLDTWVQGWEEICESLQCISVHVNHKILSPELARKIKERGKILLCYTVNEPERANTLFSWGVDGVFSDVPDKILRNKGATLS